MIEYRWAYGKKEVMPELARDVLRAQVDVMVASYEPLISAPKGRSSTRRSPAGPRRLPPSSWWRRAIQWGTALRRALHALGVWRFPC